MAYQLTYWEADGSGQAALKTVRLKSINEAWPLSLEHNHPSKTVLITVDRTDDQSPVQKIMWQKPGYLDPCTGVVGKGFENG